MSFGKRTATYGTTAAVLAIAIIGIATLYGGSATSTTSTTQLTPGQDQGQTQTQKVISTSSSTSQASSPAQGGLQALLLVQLTDPPVVPTGTTSLNLTYSGIDVIVAEPGQNNQVTTADVTVTPQGGSATVDLLQLQNVSQTIATASIPVNSTIYSLSFNVTSISIDVNGTSSSVAMATGAGTLQVTLASPTLVGNTTAALLELNPVIVDTPTGYQMIPSAVAITKGSSQVTKQDEIVGSRHRLTQQDNTDLQSAKGKVSATLVGFSSNGTTTTLTVQVNNTGDAPIQLMAIGLHGSFVTQSAGCTSTTSTSTSSSSNSTTSTSTSSNSTSYSSNSTSSSHGGEGSGIQNSNAKDSQHNGNNGDNGQGRLTNCSQHTGNELVFVPVVPSGTTTSTTSSSASTSSSSSSSSASSSASSSTSSSSSSSSTSSQSSSSASSSSSSSTSSTSSSSTTTTTTSSSSSSTTAAGCTSVTLALPSGAETENSRGLTIAPGQCVTMTFQGVVSFGESNLTVMPNTAPGQTYTLHVIASNSAETMMNCAFPLTQTSCTLANSHND